MLHLQIDTINKTKGYRFGDSGVFESCYDNTGKAFKGLRKEYGRCISKMYVGEGSHIGWVFIKKAKYDDCNEYYLQETWVSLHEAPPVKSIKYNYINL